MIDYKTRLTQDIIEGLSARFHSADLQYIEESIIKALSGYEIKEQCTQLVVYEDKNERFLKRYAACMMVDGKSSKTVDVYLRTLMRFSDFVGITFDKVTTYDIRFFLAKMKDDGISDRTAENYRSYISAFYQWMSREDMIAKNPCEKIQPIKYKDEVRFPFNETEIDAMRGACNKPKERAILELLLSSGMRVEELVNLNVDDLDFKNMSVYIREGKGKKARVTYMTEVCMHHVKKYLENRKDEVSELFICDRTKKRIRTSGLRSIVKNIGKNAGVSNVHPHRFRRTFATNLAKRGMDVQTIARLMGHSSIQTTMVYVYEDKSRLVQEYKKYTA